MVVTKIDKNAREILEGIKKEMEEKGIESPNLSATIRYMKKRIEELQTNVDALESTGVRVD